MSTGSFLKQLQGHLTVFRQEHGVAFAREHAVTPFADRPLVVGDQDLNLLVHNSSYSSII